MRVLVSGAGGFLGRQVVECLVGRGHAVRAIIRPASPQPSWIGKVETFRADLRVDEKLVSAFDGIDTVVHLAAAISGSEDVQFASTVVATERFLDAMARSSTKRLIHISSLVVYDWARAKGMMDEDTPLLVEPYNMGPYTIAKLWQERVVMNAANQHAWKLTVMRPGFIWGPHHAEIAAMGRNVGSIYLMFGPRTRLPLCHVLNCANCIAVAVENPAAIDQTFNVIDGDEIRVWQYVREYLRRTGRRGILLPLPYQAGLRFAQLASLPSGKLFGKKGKLPSLLTTRRFESQFKPIRFSNRKLREMLHWSPPLSFDDCLDLTYKPGGF